MDEKRAVEQISQARAELNWLVLSYPDNPTIRFDARFLDRIFAKGDELILEVDQLTLELRNPDGAEVTRELAEVLMPYTRSAPLSQPEAYADANRRLRGESEVAMYFGDDAVRVVDESLYVGDLECSFRDIARDFEFSPELIFPSGRFQTAFAILIAADRLRHEDPQELARRVAEYEAREAAAQLILRI